MVYPPGEQSWRFFGLPLSTKKMAQFKGIIGVRLVLKRP